MVSPSAAVQAAVATSPLTTSVTMATAAAASSSAVAGSEALTSPGDGSMEFTLDASTLEQLRGAGDASALMDSAAAGFTEPASDDQPAMQVDGCADEDWTRALVQLDGPMDSEDVMGDEEAGGIEEADGQDEHAEETEQGEDDEPVEGNGQVEGAEDGGADGGFDAGLEGAAEGTGDVCETGFVSAADDLSAAAASAGFTAAELSSHSAALDADDPAAAYMMQVLSAAVLSCGTD